jgi:hypothetical protein
MSRFGRLLIVMVLVLLSAGAAVAMAASDPSGKFKAGGHKLYLSCAGTGKPVVVLETGLGDDSFGAWSWPSDHARVLHTEVCAYDRYGLGESDGASKPLVTRTIDQAAGDLHALLNKAKVKGPYVFAAHSIGGLIDREYARRFPKDVAGMALFDTAPDDWDVYTGTKVFGYAHERLNVVAASAALRAHDNIGGKPVVVVEAGDVSYVGNAWANGKTDFTYYWDSRQRALAQISTNSIFVVARGIGHSIPQDATRLTDQAMLLVVNAVKSHKKLAACASTKLPKVGGDCNAPVVQKPADSTIS